jgi:hypothetical protein
MLPPIRKTWVEKRQGPVVTQMHYARGGSPQRKFIDIRTRGTALCGQSQY